MHSSDIESPLQSNPETYAPHQLDWREQLVNNGKKGEIEEVSVPLEMICRLNGILLDFDPSRLSPSVAPLVTLFNPLALYHSVIKKWLARHPVFAAAEVRVSGTGLHVIIWFSEPVELDDEASLARWSAAVKIIQRILPTDPDCPGITAMTRPIGSVNSKNRRTVERLKERSRLSSHVVLDLCDRIRRSPFKTVAEILLGGTSISPCPLCLEASSRFGAYAFSGMCYGHCGKLTLQNVYARFCESVSDRGNR